MAASEQKNNPPMTATGRKPEPQLPGQSSSPRPHLPRRPHPSMRVTDTERAASKFGAAFLSGIIGNPLEVAKTRLQAQAAGVSYLHPVRDITGQAAYFGSNMGRGLSAGSFAGIHGSVPSCPSDSFRYKGTLDVLYKITREEGFARLWRGASAGITLILPRMAINVSCYPIFVESLEKLTAPKFRPLVPVIAGPLTVALACVTCYPIELSRTRMQAFQETQLGKKSPGVFKTLCEVTSQAKSAYKSRNNLLQYRVLWMGMGAHIARDIPFYTICSWMFMPTLIKVLPDDNRLFNYSFQLRVIFSAAFITGSVAGALTCPLDVARTWRQIEDPNGASRMSLKEPLVEIWRKTGMRGLFAGMVPRAYHAGLSFGIVAVMHFHIEQYKHHARFSNLFKESNRS
ncbi:mitochondrial carrier protein MTM1-like isoform X1 [Punica granatum]|uniref:Mitochondrial carrier protein MTM1-like isoform X1 n=2 Tax=Punica granatum TaxID=22663 RepID=A0A6P8DDX2_PUNGR|nr:mitochondrial carrier protein MTM1-like isoform X1 [Punica granatum]